jgi:hypothetical protein
MGIVETIVVAWLALSLVGAVIWAVHGLRTTRKRRD